jgi:hypothetical protein
LTAQNRGRDFEQELAKEFGARGSIASGALWFDKLDGSGIGYRVSSKYTDKASFSISQGLIDEAVKACEGIGADGSMPIWAIRLQSPKYDLIVLRKDDFKALLEEPALIKIDYSKAELKRKRASIPQLLRDD